MRGYGSCSRATTVGQHASRDLRAEERAPPGGRGRSRYRCFDYGGPEHSRSAEPEREQGFRFDPVRSNEPLARPGAPGARGDFRARFHWKRRRRASSVRAFVRSGIVRSKGSATAKGTLRAQVTCSRLQVRMDRRDAPTDAGGVYQDEFDAEPSATQLPVRASSRNKCKGGDLPERSNYRMGIYGLQPRAGLSAHFTSAIVFFWTP